MGDVLEEALGWLERQRHKHRTRTVIYSRDAESVELKATIGKTVFRIENGSGVLERVVARDFLVRAQDLVLAAVQVLPQAGDTIREGDGGVAYTYEVMSFGGEPPWRWSDPYRRTLRIHTKQTATEVLP